MEGRFRFLLIEAETGIVLDEDGTFHDARTSPRFEPSFATREEAIALKDLLLPQFPFAAAQIYDSVTRTNELFDSGPATDQYIEAMGRWRRWAYASPWRRLFMRPPPKPPGLR